GCVMLGMSYLAWEGPCARVLGVLAASLERWDAARAHFEDAIVRCRRMGARPYLARTEYEYARTLIAQGREGDRARAQALLSSARQTASALGMSGLGRPVDAKQDGLGAPAPSEVKGAPGAAAPTGGDQPFTFAREGEYWAVTHAGATFRMKDS